MNNVGRPPHGMSFEQFRGLLTDGEARAVLGLELTDGQAQSIAADDTLALAHYDHWVRTFDPLRPVHPSPARDAVVYAPAPVPTAIAPGWYPNDFGQQQWWDGRTWGALAPQVMIVRPTKDIGIAYLFLILLGAFAAHRFYLGRIGSAIAILVLWWGGWMLAGAIIGIPMVLAAGIWLFVDLFLIPGLTREYNSALHAPASGFGYRP